MELLPAPSPGFQARKARIVSQLSLPASEYSDLSPKGSVDEGIRTLIDQLNALAGFVTTSSCAGRVSVFLEGRKAAAAPPGEQRRRGDGDAEADDDADRAPPTARTEPGERATFGGKGGGGKWLFVSHDPLPRPRDGASEDACAARLGLSGGAEVGEVDEGSEGAEEVKRLIHFKFEPMILHVLTASPRHAQVLLSCAYAAGFRESGAGGITPTGREAAALPMVGIRSMGLGFESLVGVQRGGKRELLVSSSYLEMLVEIGNERFAENTRRIERFQAALYEATRGRPKPSGLQGGEWEGAAARRERKKEEGLKRREELRREMEKPSAAFSEVEGSILLGESENEYEPS